MPNLTYLKKYIVKISLSLILLLGFIHISNANENAFSISVTPDFGIANQIGSWQVSIVAQQEISKGSVLRLLFVKGMLRGLNGISASDNYYPKFIKISSSNPNVKTNPIGFENTMSANLPFWEKDVENRIINFKLTDQSSSLFPGDTIFITINSQQSNNIQAHESASIDDIQLCYAPPNSFNFVLQKSTARFTIYPFTPSKIFLYARSIARPNSPVLFQVVANDMFNNLTPNFQGNITLNVSPPAAGFPKTISIIPGDSGRKELTIIFPDSGVYYITGTASGNIPVVACNPIWITPENYNIFWGDLHSHGDESRDGIGIARFDYAKYVRGLDFFTPTDHCDHAKQVSGINEIEWQQMKSDVLRLNQPGRFVPFLGFENSFDTKDGGHYNTYFNFEDKDIDGIPLWPKALYSNILKIWNAADTLDKKYEVLTLPHHCGKIFNINYPNDPGDLNNFGGIYLNPKYKTTIEIFSMHGLSESYNPTHNLSYENKNNVCKSADGPHYAQDAWVIGEKLGVVAGSDDHIAHPGISSNGLTAVVTANELNRNTVFKSIQNRSSYATTGERIILSFKTKDSILMGNEVARSMDFYPKFDIKIIGTDSLDYAELLKWDAVSGKMANGHPVFEVVNRWNFSNGEKTADIQFNDPYILGNSLYYLRVKQKNIIQRREVWAWTSPMWIIKSVNTSPPLDSLIQFKVSGQKIFENEAFIEILNQKQLAQYQLIRKHDDNAKSIATTNAVNPEFNKSNYVMKDPLPEDGLNHYYLYGKKKNDTTLYFLAKDSIYNRYDTINLFNVSLNANNRVEFQWNTEKEFYVQEYLLESSEDSLQFFTNKNIIPKGIRKLTTFYSESYEADNKPFVRLVIVLKNGRKLYYNAKIPISTGIYTHSSVMEGLELMNNFIVPGKDRLMFRYNGQLSLPIQIKIFDVQGKSVYPSTILQVTPGQTFQLESPDLTDGVYLLECSSGNKSITFKIMLKKL